MKKIEIYGNQEILTDDINSLQTNKDYEIQTRITDIFEPGIVAHATMTFGIVAASATAFNINGGVAYNANGERIEIVGGEIVTADAAISLGSGLYSWPNSVDKTITFPRPYSSGNMAITLTNTVAATENFVFVDFVSTVVDMTSSYGNWNSPNPKISIDQEIGMNRFPFMKNGYRVIVESNATYVNTTGTNPVHNIYTNAIYIGSVENNGTTLDIDQTTRARKKYLQLDTTQKIVTPSLTADIPATYSKAMMLSLDAHIKAVGNVDLIKINNPHGQTIYDLEYTGEDLAQHRVDQHSDGIVSATASFGANGNFRAEQTDATNIKVHFESTYDFYVFVGGNRIIRSTIYTANGGALDYKLFDFTGQPTGVYYIYMQVGTGINGILIRDTGSYANYYKIATISWNVSLGKIQYLIDDRKFGSIANKDLQMSRVPVGAMEMYIGTTHPDGWLLTTNASGAAANTIGNIGSGADIEGTYLYDLYTLLNNSFSLGGVWGDAFGEYSTPISLPDMRDRVPMGRSSTKVLASTFNGQHTHTLTTLTTGVESATHTHIIHRDASVGTSGTAHYVVNYANGTPGTSTLATYDGTAGASMSIMYDYTDADVGDHTHTLSSGVTGVQTNVNPPYIALNFIIKY